MNDEVTPLLIKLIEDQGKKIDKLESKVDELIALKNKIVAGGVILSAFFGFVWDWFKSFFANK